MDQKMGIWDWFFPWISIFAIINHCFSDLCHNFQIFWYKMPVYRQYQDVWGIFAKLYCSKLIPSLTLNKRYKDGELVYPYLRTLLQFDTQGLLNVLSIAFEEPEFKSDLGRCQKQRLVDHLLEIMVHQDSSRHSFSPSQVRFFNCFFWTRLKRLSVFKAAQKALLMTFFKVS